MTGCALRRWCRAPLWLRVLAAVLVLGGARAAAAQEEPPAGDGLRTIAQLPINLLRAGAGVFSTANVRPILVGAAATGASALFDDPVSDRLADASNRFSRGTETGSEPLYSTGVVAGIFVVGRFTHSNRFRAVSYDWLDASLVTAGYTGLLKAVVGRQRPNGSNTRSFPSGHTSNAFALAAVAERHFGWKVAVPAYAAATLVGVSRLQQNAHYLSDVAAGATLGYIVGRTVVRLNGRGAAHAGSRLAISPALGPRVRMVVVQLAF